MMGTTTMSDEPIRAGEFNATMEGVRLEMRSGFANVMQRLAAVENGCRGCELDRITQARKEGEESGKLVALKERVDDIDRARQDEARNKKALWIVAVGALLGTIGSTIMELMKRKQ
jgi:hypothetical protein